MDARLRRFGKLGRAVLSLFLAALAASGLRAAEPFLPLAVHDGRCSCILATPNSDDKFLVVVGSLSHKVGPHHITLSTEAAAGPETIPLEATTPDPAWTRHIAELRDRLARARRNLSPDEFSPATQPPRQRTFHIFVRTDDFRDPAGYVAVTGELNAVGRHCQVYVDRDWPDLDGLKPTVADAVRTFDDEVYPQAQAHLGRVVDVDRDGRFTLLFTGWLAKLCDGKVALGGFVRGSDFYRDLAVPYGNRCDMMYLNADLKPGPHLRTLIAHEYTHAVVLCEHVFGDYLPGPARQDEESWLNEGLAHLNEVRHGYSWSNLDYRLSAFLNAPERYPLVVPDAYSAGLWRSPGHRGATFYFLHWCCAQFGDDLPARLIQTNQAGIANVETATGTRFADLFRQWTAALAEGSAGDVDGGASAPGRLLCGPRFIEPPLTDGRCELEVAGTAAAYVLLHSPGAGYTRLTITAGEEAELQVSLIRVARPRGRLTLVPEFDGTDGRLHVTAHDADLTLIDAAWEKETPTERAEDMSYRPQSPAGATIRAWFGEPHLRAEETRTSIPLALPGGGPFLFKVVARDAEGRRIVAWAKGNR